MEEQQKQKWYQKRWGKVAIAVFIVAGIGGMIGDEPEKTPAAVERGHSGDNDAPTTVTVAPEPERVQPSPVEAAPEPSDEMTVSQRNAVRKAEQYLDYSAFSRPGLIEQLMFEDFSEDDATFAVDHLDVDWFAQAVAKAKQYLDYSAFSRQGLIDQLEFEGFTTEQATHAADEVGL